MHILQQTEFKEVNRRCADCNTTRTPLWRGGPAGPRSLCNACGIRYRKKKKKALFGLNRHSRTEKSNGGAMIITKEMGLHRVGGRQEWKSKLREEEKAAFLLMALSCGSVNA